MIREHLREYYSEYYREYYNVKKGQNGRKSLRRLKPTVGCNASKRRRRGIYKTLGHANTLHDKGTWIINVTDKSKDKKI